MKKFVPLIILLICIIMLTACGDTQYNPETEPMSEHSFYANVIEIKDSYIMVSPLPGSNELKSADKITIVIKDGHSCPIPRINDKVEIFYDGLIQESYPAQIPNVFRVEIRDNNKKENLSEDWGVKFTSENITSTGLTITCDHSGEEMADLTTGSYYIIQSLKDGHWVNVDYVYTENDIAWTAEAWQIKPNDKTQWDVDWEWLYGELPEGQYRIGKEVLNFKESGVFEFDMMYAEFEIKNSQNLLPGVKRLVL